MKRLILTMLAIMSAAAFLAISQLGFASFAAVLLTSLIGSFAVFILALGLVGLFIRGLAHGTNADDGAAVERLRQQQLDAIDRQIESLESLLDPDVVAAFEERARMESEETAEDPLSMTSQLVRMLRQESMVKQQINALRARREGIADFEIPEFLRRS